MLVLVFVFERIGYKNITIKKYFSKILLFSHSNNKKFNNVEYNSKKNIFLPQFKLFSYNNNHNIMQDRMPGILVVQKDGEKFEQKWESFWKVSEFY